MTSEFCAVDVGGGLLLVGGVRVLVDGEPLISMQLDAKTGLLLLSASIYDEGDQLVAEIVDNEWISGDARSWDLESKVRYLKIRLAPGHIALEIDARREPVTLRGHLWRNGHLLRMRPAGFDWNGGVSINGAAFVKSVIQCLSPNVMRIDGGAIIPPGGTVQQRLARALDLLPEVPDPQIGRDPAMMSRSPRERAKGPPSPDMPR